MAQALGYVTKTQTGGYEGALATISLNASIRIEPNPEKTGEAQPDYRVYAGNAEIGGGWNRVGKRSGNPYVSLTLSAPELGPNRVYANLGRAYGEDEDGRMAILWNPRG